MNMITLLVLACMSSVANSIPPPPQAIGPVITEHKGGHRVIYVSYTEFPPIVYKENEEVKGFDVDLFNLICEDQGWIPEYVELSDNSKRFESIVSGQADALIGGVTITEDREKLVDFTTPYMNSGILIACKLSSGTFLSTIMENKSIWNSLLILIITLLFFSHVVWLCEKGTGVKNGNEGNHIDDQYFPGIFEALWYIWITITTIGYGDYVVKKWIGRITVFVVTLIGLGIAANVIGEVSTFKVQKVKAQFSGISELDGKRIGIPSGTTSEDLANIISARFIGYKSCTDLKSAIDNNKVDAIAYDAPYILSVVKDDSSLGLVGDMLYEQSYGFAVSQSSDLREAINHSILKLMENGTINSLKVKWFGTK